MFDIAWSELLVILLVALVVVGPKDLPKLMYTIGRWMGKARAMADQFRKSFDEMARQTELEELRAEIEALRANRPLADLDQPVMQSIPPPQSHEPAQEPKTEAPDEHTPAGPVEPGYEPRQP